jgi:hypothetical protein
MGLKSSLAALRTETSGFRSSMAEAEDLVFPPRGQSSPRRHQQPVGSDRWKALVEERFSSDLFKIASDLAGSGIRKWDLELDKLPNSISVSAIFTVRIGVETYSFKVRVLTNGRHVEGVLPAQPLSLGSFKAPAVLAARMVDVSDPTEKDRARNEKLISDFLLKTLRDPLVLGNAEILRQCRHAMGSNELREKARGMWEELIRQEFRTSMKNLRHIPIMFMAKFLDQMIVEEVQES